MFDSYSSIIEHEKDFVVRIVVYNFGDVGTKYQNSGQLCTIQDVWHVCVSIGII